jgi:hypothetical protein
MDAIEAIEAIETDADDLSPRERRNKGDDIDSAPRDEVARGRFLRVLLSAKIL